MNLFYIFLVDIYIFFYHTYNQYVIISSISQNSFSKKGKKSFLFYQCLLCYDWLWWGDDGKMGEGKGRGKGNFPLFGWSEKEERNWGG